MNEAEIRSLMDRARNILDDGDHDFAMSRAYYAMFYAATAALLFLGVKRSKHSGVIAAFGQRLVKTAEFTVEQQRSLPDAFSDRSAGDYAGVFPTRADVDHRLLEAHDFVDAVVGFSEAAGGANPIAFLTKQDADVCCYNSPASEPEL